MIEEFDTSEPCVSTLPDNFIEQIVNAYLATGAGCQGKVGRAESILVEAAEIVSFALAWMERAAG